MTGTADTKPVPGGKDVLVDAATTGEQEPVVRTTSG